MNFLLMFGKKREVMYNIQNITKLNEHRIRVDKKAQSTLFKVLKGRSSRRRSPQLHLHRPSL